MCCCIILLTGCVSQEETGKTHRSPDNSGTPESGKEKENGEQATKVEEPEDTEMETLIRKEGKTLVERFDVPQGFQRAETEFGSFENYLQNLPLKPFGAKVNYYDGSEKQRDVYLSVVDFSLGERDLQQCADGVIRLRAEFLYANNRLDEISFHFVSGFEADFAKWAAGHAIAVDGNNVSWTQNGNHTSSYESFQSYLDMVFAYASTLSLEKELREKQWKDLEIGDVLIQGGSPGHCVIVVDTALNEATGEKVFMIAQSYMPAQDIHILKGDSEDSPWLSANVEGSLHTPEWTFEKTDLRTW